MPVAGGCPWGRGSHGEEMHTGQGMPKVGDALVSRGAHEAEMPDAPVPGPEWAGQGTCQVRPPPALCKVLGCCRRAAVPWVRLQPLSSMPEPTVAELQPL